MLMKNKKKNVEQNKKKIKKIEYRGLFYNIILSKIVNLIYGHFSNKKYFLSRFQEHFKF